MHASVDGATVATPESVVHVSCPSSTLTLRRHLHLVSAAGAAASCAVHVPLWLVRTAALAEVAEANEGADARASPNTFSIGFSL